MPAGARRDLLRRLSDAGIRLVSYWPRGFDRRYWDFAKELGVEALIGEPKENQFDAIEKLCGEMNSISPSTTIRNPSRTIGTPRPRCECAARPQPSHRRLLRYGPLDAIGHQIR